MKRLILLCLCLALFIAFTVLPSAVFGYAEPDENGARVDPEVPYRYLPSRLTSAQTCNYRLGPDRIYAVTVLFEHRAGGPYQSCADYCGFEECSGVSWWVPKYYDGTYCWYKIYCIARVNDNYDPNTYDYDNDGTFDIADANPDTPPSQLAKGCENTKTEYDRKESKEKETQSWATANPTGMPGLVVNLASLNFVLQDKDIAYNDINRTIEITRSYNAYSTYQGIFGRGWTFNYGVYLVADGSGNITVIRGSGAEKLFTRKTDGTYTPPKGVYDKLLKNADATFSLWSKENRLTYAFSTSGVLTSIKDANNNSVTLAYDGSGRLTTITDAAGRATAFTYNSDNQVATITDPLDRPVSFTYVDGNMHTSTDLAGVTTTFTYEDNYLMSMATPNGTTSFTYQDYAFGRRLATVTNPAGLTTHYAIDAPNSEVQVTDPLGHTTHYGYNYDGYTTYVTDSLGNKTSYGYDAAGNRNAIKDANGKTTTITYDTRGNITFITNALNKTIELKYDGRDNLTDIFDPLRRNYHFDYYDTNDNLKMITDSLTNVTEFFYYPNGLLKIIRDAREKETTLTYDQYGNLETITDPLTHSASFTYNLIGKLKTATDPLDHTTGYEYDPLGRLTRIVHPDATDFIIHRYCSGVSGITDENHLYTGYEHDPINQLKKIIDPMPLGYETKFGYDGSGNLTSLIDPKDQGTVFEYYENDWLKKTTYPEGVFESYTYDPVGTLKSRTDANGVLLTYEYDDVHRLTSITAPDLSIGYTYDDVGNLDIMTDATGTTDYDFDELHRFKKITYPTGLMVQYTYNEVGKITQIATPYGGVGYGYDDANRLTTITLPNNQQVVYQYDAAGNLLQVVYPNGAAAAYAYDNRNRLIAMTNFASADTVISTYAYTLDGVGNRTQVDLNEPMMPSYNAETINYTYTAGNILASADGATYTHDANGNRSQKATSVGTTYYTYDSLNRLTQTSTSSRQIQYIYNGLGQRVAKIDNGMQTNYLVDPNGILPQVLAETDASNNLISFYVYDGAGLVAKISSQNQYYFYHYDGLGSTIAITDNAGQVVNTYCYSPEGLVGAQETIPNPFQYVGYFGVMAEGNGLYYMRARYYDPEVGRFINKDPIGYAGGMNLYGYVENNPINFVDPFGLKLVVVGWRRGPDGQPVPMVHDTETGRTTIGFPERQTDEKFINEYLKVLAEHGVDVIIWIIMRGPRRFLETPEIWYLPIGPTPAVASPKTCEH